MLYKSLIIGVLFSIGIFAVKSGVGIGYMAGGPGKKWPKGLVIVALALIYAIVFAMVALFLPRLDPLRHLATTQSLLRSGMIVHMLMAASMMAWGLVLVRRGNASGAVSQGWLMLAVPCPVCLIVIVFSSAFLIACFPDHALGVGLSLYLVFVLIGMASMAVTQHFRKAAKLSAESMLGGAMLLIAAYFSLSMIVMPACAEVQNVYRLARHPAAGQPLERLPFILLSMIVVTIFAAGYAITAKKIRSLK